mgnify:CR=1 FL=1
MKILTIANAVPRKRLDLCALACARMEETGQFDTLHWRIIGRGPLLEEVKKMAPSSMEFLDRETELALLSEHLDRPGAGLLPVAHSLCVAPGFGVVVC